MPDYLETLRSVARSGRLGQPVFLRCLLTGAPEAAPEALAAALAAAHGLLGGGPGRLLVRGDPAAGSLHALLTLRSGATALLLTGPGEPGMDAMLLGNRGAAASDGVPLSAWQQAAAGGEPLPAPAPGPLLETVRRALAEGRPVGLPEESDG